MASNPKWEKKITTLVEKQKVDDYVDVNIDSTFQGLGQGLSNSLIEPEQISKVDSIDVQRSQKIMKELNKHIAKQMKMPRKNKLNKRSLTSAEPFPMMT